MGSAAYIIQVWLNEPSIFLDSRLKDELWCELTFLLTQELHQHNPEFDTHTQSHWHLLYHEQPRRHGLRDDLRNIVFVCLA